ncbi:hypothetical protein [Streptomyces fulvoviolaceus]|uniref:hypothetical protein n=1 Tax=Streptomyces fulvoviolaceus TaxID=285535 RepID=UPI0021BFC7F8|nr:hypothetical protein [Streptomyces fulvoviolaceus]MCT9084731.1 hypothetical protein [Streptomyces fulvoviolaceus]
MRGLPVRRIASSALCGALLLGFAGPAAVAADADSARERVQVASKAPLPDVGALTGQVKALGDLGGVLKPVTDLLGAVLKADDGQLTPEQATQLGDAVKTAIAGVTAAAPVTPPTTLPADPAATAPTATAPTTTAPTSTLPTLPSRTTSDDSKAAAAQAPADLLGDALAALQKAVDTLLTAVTSGDPTKVVPAVTGVVTSLVGVLAATLLGGGLPAANLPGLPALPSLPTGGLPLPSTGLPVPLPAA